MMLKLYKYEAYNRFITDAITDSCRTDKGYWNHSNLKLCRTDHSESEKCPRKHTLDHKSPICDEGNLDSIKI